MKTWTFTAVLSVAIAGCAGTPVVTAGPAGSDVTSPSVGSTAAPSIATSVPSCLPPDIRMGVSGSDRQATVHLPLNRADGRKLPLVVAIHGHGDSPRGFSTKTELSKHADATGYAVIYPASVGDE